MLIQQFYEIKLKPITSIECECQFSMHGHVVQFPNVDPTYKVVSVQENPEQKRPRGCPRNSWLGKVDRSYQEWLEMKRVTAGGLLRGTDRSGGSG